MIFKLPCNPNHGMIAAVAQIRWFCECCLGTEQKQRCDPGVDNVAVVLGILL